MSEQLICSLNARYPEFQLEADFTVDKGEFVSIIGPSGCGKSTTLGLITGLIPMEGGKIELFGEDITKKEVNLRNIAMVFQDYALFPHMNVQKNIFFPMKQKKMKKKDMVDNTEKLLRMMNLEGFEKRKIDGLSGGERQRIAIARALASSPDLLLLDEPLSALDAKLRIHLREEIRNLHRETGITTIYVTHDQTEALTLSDRIIVMNRGCIEQIGTPEEVYFNPQNMFVAKFMGEGNTLPYSIIPKTLTNNYAGRCAYAFKPVQAEQVLFFRPEKVRIQEDIKLTFPEAEPHLEFCNAQIKGVEFTGQYYKLTLMWNNHTITAHCDHRPKTSVVNAGIRLRDVREYINGELNTN